MKYDLEVCYACQKKVFTNLEHDDKGLVDESNHIGEEENNGRIVDNFYANMDIAVIRHD